MRIKQREVDGAVVVDISGDMHGGLENMEIVNVLDRLGERGKLDAILNLAKVNFISSTGLGILVRARSRYVRHGGQMSLCSLSKKNLSLIYVTKMQLLFDVYDSCEDALVALAS